MPSRTRAKYAAWVFLLIVSFAGILRTALAVALLAKQQHQSGPGLLTVLLFMIIGMLAALCLHELGHLLCGIAVGFTPRLYIVGPVKIEWVDGKASVHLCTDLRFFGGLAAVLPHPAPDLPRRMAVMIAGGPLANALVALLTLPSALLLTARGDTVAGFILFLFGLFAGAVGGGSLMPAYGGGFPSDGLRLLRTWQGGPQVARDCAILTAVAAVSAGQRPRDVSPALLQAILALEDEAPERATALALAYSIRLDQGDLAGAAAYLEQAMALHKVIGPTRMPGYYLDRAYVAARYEHDVETARQMLAQSKGGLGIEQASRLRAASAVSLAEGDGARAAALARQGLALLANRRLTGYLCMERDLLTELANEANRAAAL